MTIPTVFEILLKHGKCVGVALPPADELLIDALSSELHDEEIALARPLKPRRQVTFVGGRIAMRRAMGDDSFNDQPLLIDALGAPKMPCSWVGSISHKNQIAVAIAAKGGGAHVGVDIEAAAPSKHKIQKMILRPEEEENLGGLKDVSQDEEVLLRFSLKEAVYKSLNPFLKRYVGFKEVATQPLDGGMGEVHYFLDGSVSRFETEITWRREGGYFLTTAKTKIQTELI
jgi:enterobactin synthetase component D